METIWVAWWYLDFFSTMQILNHPNKQRLSASKSEIRTPYVTHFRLKRKKKKEKVISLDSPPEASSVHAVRSGPLEQTPFRSMLGRHSLQRKRNISLTVLFQRRSF